MSRIKELAARLSQWWNSNAKSGNLRREATARAQKAAGRVQDFRESERGQRAASKLSDRAAASRPSAPEPPSMTCAPATRARRRRAP